MKYIVPVLAVSVVVFSTVLLLSVGIGNTGIERMADESNVDGLEITNTEEKGSPEKIEYMEYYDRTKIVLPPEN